MASRCLQDLTVDGGGAIGSFFLGGSGGLGGFQVPACWAFHQASHFAGSFPYCSPVMMVSSVTECSICAGWWAAAISARMPPTRSRMGAGYLGSMAGCSRVASDL